jgi:hypothetical protein
VHIFSDATLPTPAYWPSEAAAWIPQTTIRTRVRITMTMTRKKPEDPSGKRLEKPVAKIERKFSSTKIASGLREN